MRLHSACFIGKDIACVFKCIFFGEECKIKNVRMGRIPPFWYWVERDNYTWIDMSRSSILPSTCASLRMTSGQRIAWSTDRPATTRGPSPFFAQRTEFGIVAEAGGFSLLRQLWNILYYNIILNYIIFYYIILYFILLYFIMFYYIILYYVIFNLLYYINFVVLYYSILCYVIVYYIVLYIITILYYMWLLHFIIYIYICFPSCKNRWWSFAAFNKSIQSYTVNAHVTFTCIPFQDLPLQT